MCGIAGIVGNIPNIEERLRLAEKVQAHRGPDAQGIMTNSVGRWTVGLAHQRLSILDLSPAGNQPMSTSEKTCTIVYNGEVYNYREIRDDLKKIGHQFTSDSDTEVVLAALNQWGPSGAFNRFNGMWALAWLDGRNNKLILARDRVGVKPLHYFVTGKAVYFSSELKGILAMAAQKFSLNAQVVGEYLVQSLLETSENTFFEGIKKVPAGTFAVIDLNSNNLSMEFRKYWSVPSDDLSDESEKVLIERVRETFIDAVRLRLRSDVPVGVLLSGGVDSSAIAAAMRSILGNSNNLNLLSAVSNDKRFDESPFIDRMAQHLGCDVNKVVLDFSPEQAFDLLEQVCWHNDEPVGSFSNIAHFLLMKQARELGITVVLSGQGADELLCGYRKYLGFYLQNLVSRGQLGKASKVFIDFWRQGTVLNQFSLGDAKRYMPNFMRPKEMSILGNALKQYLPIPVGMQGCVTVMDRQRLDVERFSVPVLVHHEDRMSMAWSREIRVPFLDYRLVEMLVPMQVNKKLSHGWTKYIFRKAIEPLLPQEITWRKDKQGFNNPEEIWLKRELKDKINQDYFNDSIIFDMKLIDKESITKLYSRYCNQDVQRGNIAIRDVFNPLALEVWLRQYSEYINI